jgi:hypothetical protein
MTRSGRQERPADLTAKARITVVRAPGASSALTVRGRDARRALPERRDKVQLQASSYREIANTSSASSSSASFMRDTRQQRPVPARSPGQVRRLGFSHLTAASADARSASRALACSVPQTGTARRKRAMAHVGPAHSRKMHPATWLPDTGRRRIPQPENDAPHSATSTALARPQTNSDVRVGTDLRFRLVGGGFSPPWPAWPPAALGID